MKIMIQIIKAEVSQMVELFFGAFTAEAITSQPEQVPRSALILSQLECIQVSVSRRAKMRCIKKQPRSGNGTFEPVVALPMNDC
jgi:hypothetical protein